MNEAALTFAVVLPALLVAHTVADHWIQTDWQAQSKGRRDATGRLACLAHVATYTITTALMVGVVWLLFDLPISPAGFLLGQLVSAVTHYWADRRFTLERLTQRWPFIRMGKHDFYRLGAPRDVSAVVLTQASERSPVGWIASGTWSAAHPPPAPHIRVDLSDKYGRVPWDNPSLGTGAYALDQSWHWFWLFVAALLTALI